MYTDHGANGTRASQPQLDKLLGQLREGDEVVVWKLDRLGRNTRNLLLLLADLESRGVHFRSITEGVSTTGAMGTAMLTIMAAFTQLERDQLSERTRAGWRRRPLLAVRRGGRPPHGRRRGWSRLGSIKEAGLNPTEVGKLLGVSRATVYRYLAMGE